MTARRSIRRVRRGSYRLGRDLGDVDAALAGDPGRIGRRLANRWIGRHVVSKLWLRRRKF